MSVYVCVCAAHTSVCVCTLISNVFLRQEARKNYLYACVFYSAQGQKNRNNHTKKNSVQIKCGDSIANAGWQRLHASTSFIFYLIICFVWASTSFAAAAPTDDDDCWEERGGRELSGEGNTVRSNRNVCFGERRRRRRLIYVIISRVCLVWTAIKVTHTHTQTNTEMRWYGANVISCATLIRVTAAQSAGVEFGSARLSTTEIQHMWNTQRLTSMWPLPVLDSAKFAYNIIRFWTCNTFAVCFVFLYYNIWRYRLFVNVVVCPRFLDHDLFDIQHSWCFANCLQMKYFVLNIKCRDAFFNIRDNLNEFIVYKLQAHFHN